MKPSVVAKLIANRHRPRGKRPPGYCRYCGKFQKSLRPRGLCWTCYNTPEIKGLYPKCGDNGTPDRFHAPPPRKPTRARPGTEIKVRVLEWRARKGYALFHPADAPIDCT